MLPLLFTTATGEVFEMASPELPESATSPPMFETPISDLDSPFEYFDARRTLDGIDDKDPGCRVELCERLKTPFNFICNPSCPSARPLIKIVDIDDLIKATTTLSVTPKLLVIPPTKKGDRRSSAQAAAISMVYNEYGELVDSAKQRKPPIASELSSTGILRVFKKGFHHYFRNKMGDIVVEELRARAASCAKDGRVSWYNQLSSWLFDPSSPDPEVPESQTVPALPGQARVLELGCGDGKWCLRFKSENPKWLVDGIDDTNHWRCAHPDLVLRDFIEGDGGGKYKDYFSRTQPSDCYPEFTVRNLNALLQHTKPIPRSLYGLIRGRDIFDRVESYTTFLDTIRLILQPEGVVEFLEIDPRPRTAYAGPVKHVRKLHKSGSDVDWKTNKIADRFKDEVDPEITTNVPGWSGRVEARLKANLRPRDGVVAANLKHCLQGAGFYDVKQHILRLPIGGDTCQGQHMQELVLERIELEDSIPTLKAELPTPELDQITSGKYWFNLHIVTGRKPSYPRTGDLLTDGTRQEMTPSTYDAMARLNSEANKSSQWKRYDLDNKLTTMLESLATHRGVPVPLDGPLAATVTRGDASDGLGH